uniref:IRS-type PTB domain-containing protein n=1 Tax=Parascaris univalens TaxID=6257 RepID=A0A915BDL4_PARUN
HPGMGNCVSQTGQKEFLKSLPATASESFPLEDPESFRVFVKKRSKFIPGTLKVTENEIIFWRTCNDTLNWPLHYLRRYGFTSAGIFFFESGRRCTSGEGLHTFQSPQAEAIFQLVQSRIHDSANMGMATRDLRAQSVTGSIRSTHSSLSGYTALGARIHPIQRYSSEGTNNLADYLQPSYSNCHRPPNRFFYHRPAMQQVPKRPRSLATPGHASVWALSQPVFHPHQYRDAQRTLMGNIVSERVIQRQSSRLSSLNHSYVNVGAQRQMPSYSLHSLASSGSASAPLPRSEHKNDAMNMSINVWGPPHRSISENNSPAGDKFFYERYVNIKEMTTIPILPSEREVTPPQLDYASVNVGTAEDSSSLPPRTSSFGARSETSSVNTPSNVNYAKIDLERTHAVEMTANATEKENPHRRHYNGCVS